MNSNTNRNPYRYNQQRSNSCGSPTAKPCGPMGNSCIQPRSNGVDNMPIGMAYVPWQEFTDLYDPHQGLACGTIFAELNKPFLGKRGACL